MATIMSQSGAYGSARRCDARCHHATGLRCHCICGGRYHGAAVLESNFQPDRRQEADGETSDRVPEKAIQMLLYDRELLTKETNSDRSRGRKRRRV
jgi:hypothetical protein